MECGLWIGWFAYERHVPLLVFAIFKNWLALGGAVSSQSVKLHVPDHQEYRKYGNIVNTNNWEL